jgi:hypothetical protein
MRDVLANIDRTAQRPLADIPQQLNDQHDGSSTPLRKSSPNLGLKASLECLVGQGLLVYGRGREEVEAKLRGAITEVLSAAGARGSGSHPVKLRSKEARCTKRATASFNKYPTRTSNLSPDERVAIIAVIKARVGGPNT